MDADRACVTLFTSGSTGAPKRIIKTVRQLEAGGRDRRARAGPDRAQGRLGSRHGRASAPLWPDFSAVLADGHPSSFLRQRPSILGTLAGIDGSGLRACHESFTSVPSRRPGAAAGRTPTERRPVGRGAAARRRGQAPRARCWAAPSGSSSAAPRPVSSPAGLRDGSEQPSWQPMPGVAVTRLDDGRMRVRSPYLGNPDDEVSERSDRTRRRRWLSPGGTRRPHRQDRGRTHQPRRVRRAAGRAARASPQAAVVVLGGSTPYLGGVVVLDAVGTKRTCALPARSGSGAACGATCLPACRRRPCRAAGVSCRTCRPGRSARQRAADLAALFDVPQANARVEERHGGRPPKVEPEVLACRQTAEGVELDLRIDADLAPLAGHFPGLPIVPGVCLLDWVVRFSGRHLGLPQDGATQVQIKFRQCSAAGLRRDAHASPAFGSDACSSNIGSLDTVYSSGTISAGGA